MSRSEVILTDTFQQIAAGKMVMTVKKGLRKQLTVNDVDSDVGAYITQTTDGQQLIQEESKATWAKGVDITVIVDEV